MPKKLTRQQVFNKCVIHTVRQGVPSLDAANRCSYRGEKGRMCTVGPLISNRHYCEEMEEYGVAALLANAECLEHLLPFEDMLYDLQRAHDKNATGVYQNKATWLRRFCNTVIGIAKDYNLSLRWVEKEPNWKPYP